MTNSNVSFESIAKQKGHIKDKVSDANDYLEKTKAEKTKLEMEKEIHDQRMKDRDADRKLRDTYAGKIIKFLYVYASIVAFFVFMHAFKISFELPQNISFGSDPFLYLLSKLKFSFSLPTEVLIALVGSTALAAIGLVGFVAKGLFKNN